MSHENAYGLWGLALLNAGLFIFFAYSFTKPLAGKRDWRALGAFSAFVVALFAEMYGFPLTIYLLSGWLARRLPGVDLYGHDQGHLWWLLLGGHGDAHTSPLHIAANVVIAAGFWLLSAGWSALWTAQREGRLATTGPYAVIRHPQYVAFVAIMLGFLVMWPTLPTLLMFPVLVVAYARLARREDRETHARFGEAWERWAARTPAFFPRIGGAPAEERHV